MKTTPITFMHLLISAKKEYIETQSFQGPQMVLFAAIINDIAGAAYSSGVFRWSDYNRTEWERFTTPDAPDIDVRDCTFSAEPNGEYESSKYDEFRAIHIGVPYGKNPYKIWIRASLAQKSSEELCAWLTKFGYPTS